jgi:hypothetical protein
MELLSAGSLERVEQQVQLDQLVTTSTGQHELQELRDRLDETGSTDTTATT